MKHIAYLAFALIAHPFVRAFYWCQEKAAAVIAKARTAYATAKNWVIRKALAVRTWCVWKLSQALALFGVE